VRIVPLLALAAVLTAGCTPQADVGPGDPGPSVIEPAPRGQVPQTPSPEPTIEPTPDAPAAAELPPSVPDDASGLAAAITEAERTIRSGAADVERAGRQQQAAYRALAARPELRSAVLAEVPEDLHGVVVAHTDALVDLLRLTKAQPQLPAWRIVAPPPPDELLGYYREAEQEFGVGWEYLAAIHLVESRMGRIRGTSPAGAQGPMQFIPATWEIYGEGDINDPRDAVRAAGRYLKASGAPGNMRRALFAYNRSDAYVRAITAHAEQMRATPETYYGYWHWQVYYRTVDGDRVLPVGYDGAA
jgi:membrane-bound lytic murein transglycosylase B